MRFNAVIPELFVRDAGGKTICETEFLVLDPDGYLLRFSSPAEK
jgi:hypothetical protein